MTDDGTVTNGGDNELVVLQETVPCQPLVCGWQGTPRAMRFAVVALWLLRALVFRGGLDGLEPCGGQVLDLGGPLVRGRELAIGVEDDHQVPQQLLED